MRVWSLPFACAFSRKVYLTRRDPHTTVFSEDRRRVCVERMLGAGLSRHLHVVLVPRSAQPVEARLHEAACDRREGANVELEVVVLVEQVGSGSGHGDPVDVESGCTA